MFSDPRGATPERLCPHASVATEPVAPVAARSRSAVGLGSSRYVGPVCRLNGTATGAGKTTRPPPLTGRDPARPSGSTIITTSGLSIEDKETRRESERGANREAANPAVVCCIPGSPGSRRSGVNSRGTGVLAYTVPSRVH